MNKVINKAVTRQKSLYKAGANVAFEYYYYHFLKIKTAPSIELNIDGYTNLKIKADNV